uniref:Uncharacterized protein n=1 Tax=Nelumbo nucifera TaxID=4432 RepID=A0A822YZB4_NELNU|nr:TPA_asm: hypothetical protein HUJ06_008683 [Nelumbo nucifera]
MPPALKPLLQDSWLCHKGTSILASLHQKPKPALLSSTPFILGKWIKIEDDADVGRKDDTIIAISAIIVRPTSGF